MKGVCWVCFCVKWEEVLVIVLPDGNSIVWGEEQVRVGLPETTIPSMKKLKKFLKILKSSRKKVSAIFIILKFKVFFYF